ncbi:hypothetical protein GPECTOR_8g30 [Gonium pectorale]|uniref:RAP domain-containing protein n=1 Tax=Gonium pectorale TaxID=33097 RepID=A0A150GSY2_GONPE|nr:hypothetical protein GPECTOR_8g30 [Gonium pectorale]|eukprot:KXZ52923.1 hypothetical protein GPECTOR_8g30 [Gonium pectorale]
MSTLAAAYLPLVPELWRPQDFTGPLWACAKAGHWGDGLAAALLAQLTAGGGELLQRASGREISNLWWSLSSGAPAELLAAPAADAALRISGQRLMELEAGDLNAHDCSNVLIAAARLQRGPEALWDHMTRCLAAAAPSAHCQALANGLYALGSLAEDCGHTPRGRQQDLQRLEAEVGSRLEGGAAGDPPSLGGGFNPQLISNMLWGLAKLRRTDSPLLQPLAEAAGLTAVVGFNAQNLSNSLWALATLGCSGAEYVPAVRALLGATQQLLQQQPNAFSAQNISNSLWAMATLGCSGAEYAPAVSSLLDATQKLMQQQPAAFNAQSLSNSLWALATLGCSGAKYTPALSSLTGAVQHLLQQQPITFNAQELPNILWALATLQQPSGSEALIEVAAAECHRRAFLRFSPQGISNAAWALAKMPRSGLEPYPQWYQGWYEAAVQAAMQPGFVGAANPQEWSNLLYALGLVRHRPPAALLTLAAESTELRTEANAQDCTNCLWSLAVLYGRLELLDGGSRAAVEALVGVLAGRLRQLLLRKAAGERPTAQGLCNSLWALAVMGADVLALNSGLTRSLVDEVAQRLEAAGPGIQVEELAQLRQVHLELAAATVCSPGLQLEASGNGLLGCASLQATWWDATDPQQQNATGSAFQLQVLEVLAALQQAGRRQRCERLPAIASVQAKQWLPQLGRSVDAVVELEGGRRLAVAVDGPTHFLANGEHWRTKDGRTQLRDRQLERVFGRGNVLSVPYWEWDALRGGKAAQEDYLWRVLLGLPGAGTAYDRRHPVRQGNEATA